MVSDTVAQSMSDNALASMAGNAFDGFCCMAATIAVFYGELSDTELNTTIIYHINKYIRLYIIIVHLHSSYCLAPDVGSCGRWQDL